MNNWQKTSLGLGVAGSALWLGRRQLLATALKLPPAQNRVRVSRNIRVPMDDGITLATDVYHPRAKGTFPTILMRTPYGRNGILGYMNVFFAQRFAERGYNVVVQDVRGRFDSEGDFEPYIDEARDGAATIDWIGQQAWHNGKLGMWGASYGGYVQWAAVSASPHVDALVPLITRSQLGGVSEHADPLDLILRWMLILDALVNKELPLYERLLRSLHAPTQNKVLAQGLNHLPLGTADEQTLGYPVSFFQKWQAHSEANDAYWQAIDHRGIVATAPPAHFIGGWYDIFLDGMLVDYTAQQVAGRQPYLTIGAWTHVDIEAQVGTLPASMQWFDALLKGEARRRAQPVRVYVMGADEWREFVSWPPPATPTEFWLHGNGWSRHGTLQATPPPPNAPSATYRYNPADPTPNVGGALLSVDAGARDNRQLEAREDVLTYTTAPLTEAVEVIGYVRLEVFVQSSAVTADFFGRLTDVHPDGRSLNLCDGIFRVKPERGDMQSDGSRKIIIDLSATAYHFAVGHHIRLQLSSGAHPRFARNLGTDEPVMNATKIIAADQAIYHDAEHPSRLILPIH